jgi:hypothetical protein
VVRGPDQLVGQGPQSPGRIGQNLEAGPGLAQRLARKNTGVRVGMMGSAYAPPPNAVEIARANQAMGGGQGGPPMDPRNAVLNAYR